MTKLYTSNMDVAKWYGTSVRIPQLNTPNFMLFASSCFAMATSLIDKKLARSIHVGYSSTVPTAYADAKKCQIVVSDKFFGGNFSALGQGKFLNGSDTLGAIMGIMLHEVGHFAYSPDDLSPQVEYIRQHTSNVFNLKLASKVSNTIEDIYIEYQIARAIPSLVWTLESTNKVMLTEEIFNEDVKKLSRVNMIMSSSEQLNILNFLLFAKVTDNPSKVSSFVKRIFKLARQATLATNLDDRLALCLAVYDAIQIQSDLSDKKSDKSEPSDKSEDDQSPDDSQESDNSQSDSQESDDTEDNDQSDSSGDDTGDDQSDNDSQGNNADDTDDTEDDNTDDTQSDNDPVEIPIIDGMNANAPTGHIHEIGNDNTTITIDATGEIFHEENLEPYEPITLDKRYSGLADIARQRATINRRHSTPQRTGRDMRNIHRIIQDQRIFSDRLPTNGFEPMEIMIVLDCSVSMDGYKFIDAIQATMGCAQALINGQCSVQVYGHTTLYTGVSDILIYPLLRSGESPMLLSKRLGRLKYETDMRLHNTRDGHTLLHLSKKFHSANRKRLMIVISDGQPWSTGYKGLSAIEHTQRAVNTIRSSGIDVVSISIDNLAFDPNNMIYGRDKNICNESPTALDDLVKSILLN